jgi:uncharacterized protein (DUF2062 family)
MISVIGAALGYVIAAFTWRWWIAHKWRHRRAHRALQAS